MTTEERFDRIEHVTAGIVEQAKQDREENRDLWRQTQRQLGELAGTVATLAATVGALAKQMESVPVLAKEVDRLVLESAIRDREARERDRILEERIASLVSAIGDWIRSKP